MEKIVELDGKTLVIRLPLQKPGPSKSSGKSLVIASTHGVLMTGARYRGKTIALVANAFVYRNQTEEMEE